MGTKVVRAWVFLAILTLGAAIGLACGSQEAETIVVEKQVAVEVVVETEKEVIQTITKEITALDAVFQVYSWYPPFMPGTVGMVKELYEVEGIKVSPLESRGGADSVRVLQTTAAVFGTSATIAAITAMQAGEPLKIIGSMAPAGSAAWQVVRGPNHPLGESPLMSASELPVGTSITASRPGSQSEQMAFVMADRAGLAEGEWQLVHSGGVSANIALLDEGVIDVGFAPGVPRFAGNVASGHWKILLTWDEIEWWLDSVQVAKQSVIDNNPEWIQAFWKGTCAAKNWMVENADSDELVSILMQQTGTDEDGRDAAAFIIAQLMDDSQGRGPEYRWGDFKLDLDMVRANLQKNVGFGNIKAVPGNLDEFFLQEFHPATC